jgi:tagatose-1,6-bisphosphate aldolase non-catalytic subunit AgaZ/GatZ
MGIHAGYTGITPCDERNGVFSPAKAVRFKELSR